MPQVNARANQRANFLLSKFAFFPIIDDDVRELRFDYQLPRGEYLSTAISRAMANEGITELDPKLIVDVTEEALHHAKYVLGLFVKTDPRTVVVDGVRHTTYAWACTQSFRTRGIGGAIDVIAKNSGYQKPTPILELRTEKENIYYLLTLALRKSCDSKPTSIVWNATQFIKKDTVEWFVNLIHGAIVAQEYESFEKLAQAVKKACLEDHEYIGKSERALIHCAFELFSDQDWEGMLSNVNVWDWEIKERQKSAP